MWAEAVWSLWLPLSACKLMITRATEQLPNAKSVWNAVCGPAAAYVASAWRLGWQVTSATTATTDDGQLLDYTRDAPAYVRVCVINSVWRWRWARVTAKVPSLQTFGERTDVHFQPVFKLLQSKCCDCEWGAKQKGALESTISNKQWPQARLHSAKLVTSPNCRLCVALGLCDAEDPNAAFKGTLLHRIWVCPALEKDRIRLVPPWLLRLARSKIKPDHTMAPEDLALFTRALMPSLRPGVSTQPADDTFHWIKKPIGDISSGIGFVDGSRLHGNAKFYDLTAVRGWAVAVYDRDGEMLAAAHGRPPLWAQGIHATELWGLLMAIQITDAFSPIRTDCLAVKKGTTLGLEWANSPARVFGRAWGPVATALEGNEDRLAWMPAHCASEAVGVKKLSNGQLMQGFDRRGNAAVDTFAKQAAKWDEPPVAQRQYVLQKSGLLTAIAKWIGQSGVIANHYQMPEKASDGKGIFIRDSEGFQARRRKPTKRKIVEVTPSRTPGDLSSCPRWAALRRRIIDKAGAG